MAEQADVNRLFLQSMISRGPVPEKLAQIIWKKCVEAVNAVSKDGRIPFHENKWHEFVEYINISLDKLDLAFKSTNDQRTGQAVYSIINVKGDGIAQMATEYTPAEIAYFKALVEQIVLAPRNKYSVSSLVAMREVSMIKPKSNITKSQAEVVLSTFVAKGWLVKSKSGRYSLSPRSLIELCPYLQSNYADHILNCSMCGEILTTGVACFNVGCKWRVHPYCFKRYSRLRTNGALQCKDCQQELPRDINSGEFIPIGERAVKTGEKEQRVCSVAESDREEDDEGYDAKDIKMESHALSQSQSQLTQTQVRMASKSKGKRRNDEADEDVPQATSAQRSRRNNR